MTRIIRSGLQFICRLLARFFLDLKVDGRQHVPATGPVLIACRHYHYQWDGIALLAALPRSTSIVVALDWVPMRWLRVVMEFGCRLLDWPIILRREALSSADSRAYASVEERGYVRRAVARVSDQLQAGGAVIVFPEGYPNIDPVFTLKHNAHEFLPVRAGFLLMAMQAERKGAKPVAIVPAGLHYQHRRIMLRLGAPLYLHDFPNREALRRMVETQTFLLSREQPG